MIQKRLRRAEIGKAGLLLILALAPLLCVWCVILCAGCSGGDARVEMSAADGLNALADQFDTTIDEYHQDLAEGDTTRESAVIAAFVSRVQRDNADAMDKHTAEFSDALAKIRGDREVEFDRRNAAKDNVITLREIGKGLQQLAVQSMTLNDEARRYLTGWVSQYQQARKEAAAASAERKALKKQKAQELSGTVLGLLQKQQAKP